MSFHHNPNIITEGLVLYVDASNSKSYNGSGTTWYDLSGYNKHLTLVNDPTFTTDIKNCFNFNGTTQNATFSNPLNQSNLNQEWTISTWINITDKVSQSLIAGLNNGLYVCFSQGNNSLLYLNSGDNDYYIYGGDLGNIGWTYATFRFSNSDGSRTIYKNDINISTSGPNKTSTPSGQASTFTLASGLEGKINSLIIYNRYINNTELLFNFNSTRKKFGI